MKKSNFSKNEYEYLTNRKKIEAQYKMNYIYQIRMSIMNKVQWMVDDIALALKFNKNSSYRGQLWSHGYSAQLKPFHKIVKNTISSDKGYIRNILEIPELGKGVDPGRRPFGWRNSNPDLEKFIFDAYKNKRDLGIRTLERILKRLKKG